MNKLAHYYDDIFLPLATYAAHLIRRNKPISLGLAIALSTVYLFHETVFKPPKSMRDLPRVPVFSFLRAIMTNTPYHKVARRYTVPTLLKANNGLYTRLDWDGWALHITSPDLVKKLLLRADLFNKIDFMSEQEGNLISRFVFGPNIVVLNGAAWKKHRQIANPAFQRAMPVRLFAELSHTMFKVLDREIENGPVEIHDIFVRWTLQVLGLSMFGFDFDALENEESPWVKIYNNINHGLFDMKYIFFPFLDRYCLSMLPKRRAIHDELTEFLQLLESIINKKRATLEEGTKDATVPDSERDLLELMLESEQTTRGKLTNAELLSDLCVFFMAGHESTANALTFAIYYLAIHPDVQEKARQEIIDHFGETNENIFPTAEETKKLPYLNAVIKETLRIAPPATSLLVRHLTEDTNIGGTVYPKQTRVVFDIYEMQHNPRYWSDPEVFNPDRFMPGGEAEQLAARGDSMAWNPFSNGARQCIGANFSLAEQRIMLPLLLRKYEWCLPADFDYPRDHPITNAVGAVGPLNLKVSFTKRQ